MSVHAGCELSNGGGNGHRLVVPGKHTGCGFSCGPFRLEEQHEPWDRQALLQTASSHPILLVAVRKAVAVRTAELPSRGHAQSGCRAMKKFERQRGTTRILQHRAKNARLCNMQRSRVRASKRFVRGTLSDCSSSLSARAAASTTRTARKALQVVSRPEQT